MPRERVQHGKIYVIEAEGATDVIEAESGQPTGVKAHATHIYAPGEDLKPGDKLQEEPSIDISWNREVGWVQIGFEAPTDWWSRFLATFEDEDNGQTHHAVYADTLTRQEINHMIRTLRRARDAAFGADE